MKDKIATKPSTNGLFRIKTIKLRERMSQGLLVPILEDSQQFPIDLRNLEIGCDVTKELSVQKYEPNSGGGDGRAERIERINKFPFPSHLIDKTDEDRIQSNPKLLLAIHKQPFVMTVKHDGTSVTFLEDPKDQTFLVCSRNQWRPKTGVCVYWSMATKYGLEEKLRGTGYAIQGEICGPKIQKNLLNLKEPVLFVFNVIHIQSRQAMQFTDMCLFCEKLGVPTVYFVESGDEFNLTLDELLKKAEGTYPNTKNEKEGIVVRSKDCRVSFKVINNNYLLKNDY